MWYLINIWINFSCMCHHLQGWTSFSYSSFFQQYLTKDTLLEKGHFRCPQNIRLCHSQTEVSCLIPRRGPLTTSPAPTVCRLFSGHMGQRWCSEQHGAGAWATSCKQALPCPWADGPALEGKEAPLRSSCLHSSWRGLAIKSKLNSHCSLPPWSWQANILPSTKGSRMFAAGPLTPAPA